MKTEEAYEVIRKELANAENIVEVHEALKTISKDLKKRAASELATVAWIDCAKKRKIENDYDTGYYQAVQDYVRVQQYAEKHYLEV